MEYFKSVCRSARCAVAGLLKTYRSERSIRLQSMIGWVVVSLGLVLHIGAVRLALVILSIGVIIALETVNTAIEKAMDFVEPEHHPTVGLVKDLAAGAVAAAVVTAMAVCFLAFFL